MVRRIIAPIVYWTAFARAILVLASVTRNSLLARTLRAYYPSQEVVDVARVVKNVDDVNSVWHSTAMRRNVKHKLVTLSLIHI